MSVVAKLSVLSIGAAVRVISEGIDLTGTIHSMDGDIINVAVTEVFENTGGEYTNSVKPGTICTFRPTEVVAE